MTIWLLATFIALVFFGVTGVTQKICTNNISFEMSFVYFAAGMAVISAAVPLVTTLTWAGLTVAQVCLIASGGLLNGLGAYTSFAAFERGGKASIVIPIVNLYSLITVLGAWLLLGEALTTQQVCGLVLAFVAVILLSRESPAPIET